MHPSRVRALYRRLQQANPNPTTELEHKTPFELLAAVMLSAHTTDKSVNTATRVLFPIANTPQAILAMGIEGIKPYLKVVGMYNQKSKNLIELCRQLVDKHGGEVPRDRESLEALPGVGRKTANIILNMVFGESTIAVDTHIFRVSNRTGLAEGEDPRIVEDELNEVTPDEYKKDAHHWLLLHGRYVCTARLPACPKCIIADLCEYPHKTPPKELPASDAPVAHEKTATPRKQAATRTSSPGERTARTQPARAGERTARTQSTARSGKRTARAPTVARAAPKSSVTRDPATSAAPKAVARRSSVRTRATRLGTSRSRRG
jgi:endonuclease III